MGGRKKYVPIPGVWSAEHRREVERIQLPDKIICCICKQHCSLQNYSEGQLIVLRNLVSTRGQEALKKQAVAKCVHCSCSSSVERLCVRCHSYRSIDEFSRSQRSREHPVCQPCADYEEVQDYFPLALTGEKDGNPNDETATMSRGLIKGAASQTNTDTALVLHVDRSLAPSSSVFNDPNPRKFAKIKTHRPPKEERPVVPRPDYGDLDQGLGAPDANPSEYL